MRHLKLAGLALVAVLASAMALASLAFAALPVNLPTSAVARAFTGSSTGAALIAVQPGQENIECASASGTGEEEVDATTKTTKPLGPFHVEFKGCKTQGTKVTCTGLGDAAGIKLALGTWHLVFDQLTPTLLAAVLLLFETIHYNCSALVLGEELGELLCLALNPTVKALTHEAHCVVEGGNKQQDEKYFDDNGNAVNNVTVLCSINHAAEKPCYGLGLGSATYGVEIFADI